MADVYLKESPDTTAAAWGAGRPMVMVNSRSVELFDEEELRTVLGHEVGHVLSDHVLYRTALMILLSIGTSGLPMMAGLPLAAVRIALLEWFRAAELSCDRAATLVNRDPLVTSRTLLVMAGGAASRKLNLDAFLKQANEYEEWAPGWDKLARLRVELAQTHAFPVRPDRSEGRGERRRRPLCRALPGAVQGGRARRGERRRQGRRRRRADVRVAARPRSLSAT